MEKLDPLKQVTNIKTGKDLDLREVVYKKPFIEYSDKKCPNCEQYKLVSGSIPCPDNQEGCLVLHYGLTCENCGKVYNY